MLSSPVWLTGVAPITLERGKSYDLARGFLTGVKTKLGGNALMDLVYGRDEAGRVMSVVNNALASNTENWTYGYDDFGQLVRADNAGTNLQDRSYAYDLAGNMTATAASIRRSPRPAARPIATPTAS